VGISRLGSAVLQQQRAQAVADLVALAAAGSGDPAAIRVATANDARIVRTGVGSDGAVGVTVHRAGVGASAAAARD
jgi:uncharacterized membrane protein